MGRTPKTPHELRLAGSWRAGEREKAAPRFEPGRPVKPAMLDDGASAHWDRLCPILESMGVLTVADGMALALLCDTWSRYEKATRELARCGEVYETIGRDGNKMLRRHPIAVVARELERDLRSWLAVFGLTASSRGRVHRVAAPAPTSESKPSIFTRRRGDSA